MKTYIEKEVFLGTMSDMVQLVISNTKAKVKKPYYAINSDCMLNYWKDIDYQEIINNKESFVYVDGMGVIYAQKLLGLPISKERIATTDLFPALVDALNKMTSHLRIFLLGGEKETAEKVRQNFNETYPNVKIVGTHHGYFDKAESSKVIEQINELAVDILFVGFGNPVQEKWVHQHYNQLQVSTFITCGGLFDYYANNVKRAPLFMQKIGLEWLFRLLQEPKRLYKRYIFGNMKYISRILYLRLMQSSRKLDKGLQ